MFTCVCAYLYVCGTTETHNELNIWKWHHLTAVPFEKSKANNVHNYYWYKTWQDFEKWERKHYFFQADENMPLVKRRNTVNVCCFWGQFLLELEGEDNAPFQ